MRPICLEDAEAGRNRIDYTGPKTNRNANSNANVNANTNANVTRHKLKYQLKHGKTDADCEVDPEAGQSTKSRPLNPTSTKISVLLMLLKYTRSVDSVST